MKVRWRSLCTLAFAASFACGALAGDRPHATMTLQAACERLRVVISKQLGASHGADEYRCEDEATMSSDGYYVFALRSNYPAPKGAGLDWVGSDLAGWYAVRNSGGQVREWDVANLRLGAAIR